MRSMTKKDARLLAPGLLMLLAVACNKTEATDTAAAEAAAPVASTTAAAAPADADAGADIAPPPPVVAGDPDVPLNEAVVGAAPVPADYSAAIAPPAPVSEEQPASPETGDVWVPGYWWWSIPLTRYVWVSGAWRNPPPDQVWTHGEWVSNPAGRYVWVPGFWGPHGAPAAPVADLAPPPPRPDPPPPMPGVGFEWTPGFYDYHDRAYAWTAGSWRRPPVAGVGWVEPRYVGIGGQYHFQPGRWDHPVEHRGVVYRPDINVHAGARFAPQPVPAELVNAHARYVTGAAHALAYGGTRLPNGGFTMRRPVDAHTGIGAEVRPGVPPGELPHGGPLGGEVPHGGPPPGEAPHGGPPGEAPHGGPPAGGTQVVGHGAPPPGQRTPPGNHKP
jgi:WXXGXW repeat (2 copies)